ncbi:hypothetical protein Sango_2047000 [Sesamum angolense]|uniref:DDE Tnp4 domain-containing protein n=1 Tax=Sesamum angolense TaxID=2727404 RepID=A0AAE1WG16_9LAMI|nr:hypothetical protein Sango_2047000 [Sesamum angolense]
MCFIYVLAGWEDSAADGRVLRDAISRPNGLKIPRGNYYLVDSGYSKREGFLSPYRGVRSWTMIGALEASSRGENLCSKIDVWKKTYACITDMLARSGIGLNMTTQMIVVSDEVFKSYVKIDHFAKTLRFKSFLYYLTWTEIFGKDRVTREHAEDIYMH